MGYYRGTKVKCTKPELFYTGSTFNKEWKDFIIDVKSGVTEYYCAKEYLNNALRELSKEHPEVTFSGITWIDDDYENAIDYTFILKAGSYEYVKMAPHYQIFFPIIKDEDYKRLAEKFSEQIHHYLNRIDLVIEDVGDESTFDFLNDKEDEEGFKSYVTITWENEYHKFTATKRFTSHVIVDYQRINPSEKEQTKIDEHHSNDNQDDSYESLPF